MSINLGSAHAEITLKVDGATKNAKALGDALRDLESSSSGVGPNLAKAGESAGKIGDGAAKGAKAAASSLKELSAASADVAPNLERAQAAGSKVGEGVARSATQAAKGVDDLAKAAGQAGPNLDRAAQAGSNVGKNVASGAADATANMRDLARSAQDVEQSLGKVATTAGLVGGALTAGLGLAAKSAADLQSEVVGISTIKPEIDVSQVSGALSEMSTRVAQSQTELAAGLYNIFSSIEVSQADGLKLVEQFAQGAVAAKTDADTFGTAILGVMNAYKLSVSDAAHVSDVFFNTVNVGVVSSEELAHNLGNVTQTAKAAGVNFDELGGLIAGVTKEGGNASQNINNLSNLFQKIVTTDAQKALKELGVETTNADGSLRKIVPVLEDLKRALDGMSEADRAKALQNIFPDAQARLGVNVLLSQLDFVKGAIDDNAKAAGVASEAYRKMGETANSQGVILKNTLTATLTQLGDIALPDLVGAAKGVQALVSAFQGLPDGVQRTIVGLTEVGAVALLGGAGLVKAAQGALELQKALVALNVASKATTAINALTTALGPLTVAFLAAEVASRALTGDSILTSLGSLVKYGDLLGGARDQVKAFGEANKDNLPAVVDEVDRLNARLAELQKLNAENADFSIGAILDLPNQPQRNKEINETILKLRELLKLRDQMVAQGPVYGPPSPYKSEGPSPEAAQGLVGLTDGFGKVAQAASQSERNVAAAKAIVAAMGGVANDATTGIGNLSEAYFVNAKAATDNAAAIQAAANQQQIKADLAAQLQGQASAMQAATSAAQPLQAAFDLLNQKVAAGIPLSAQQQQLLNTLPGYLVAAKAGYDDLITGAAQTAQALQNAGTAAPTAGAGFGTLGGQATALKTQLDQLRASSVQLEGALGALGTENSKLSSYYNILGERVDVLNAKKKEGAGLSAAEASELATLTTAQEKLGGAMGGNAAQMRSFVLGLLGINDQTATTTGQLNAVNDTLASTGVVAGDAKNGITGLNDGMGGIVTSAGGAKQAVEDVGTAVSSIPPTADVKVNVEPPPGGAQAVAQAAGAGPDGSVTVPVKVDLKPNAQAGAQQFEDLLGPSGGASQTVNITANDQATPVLNDVKAILTEINTTPATAVVGVTDNASSPIDQVKQKLTEYAQMQPNPSIAATDNASGTVATVTANINNIPADHTTTLGAIDNASGPVNGLAGSINNIPRSFTVTANVDISGALANIERLNNNIPHSPAKEGVFRRLPTWKAVWEGLETSGAEAVDGVQATTGQLAKAIDTGIGDAAAKAAKDSADLTNSIAAAVKASNEALTGLRTFRAPDPRRFAALRDALAPILESFAADAAAQSEEGLKAVGAYAENVGKIVGVIGNAADALQKINGFKRSTDAALTDFRDASQFLVGLMLDVARDSDAKLTEAGATYAEGAGKIYTSVGQGTDALVKLRDFQRPTDRALTDFRDVAQFVVNLLAQVAADAELDAVADAASYADSASKIYGSIGTGVEALVKLQGFARPTDQAVKSFRDVAQFAVNLINQVAADGEQAANEGGAKWADAALKMVQFLSAGVDALAKLDDFTRPTDLAVTSFRDVSQFLVNVVTQVAADSEAGPVAAAATYAENAQKIAAFVGTAAEALTALQEFEAPRTANIEAFARASVQTTAAVIQASAGMDDKLLAQAATYADTAGKVVGLVGNGAKSLAEFAKTEFVAPDRGKLDGLATATRDAVISISAAASDIKGPALRQAADYADGAGKVVALIGNGAKGFADLATFTAPTTGQINAFKSAVSATVIAIAQASREIDKDAVKAAGDYSDGAGKAVGLLGGAVSAFKGIGDKDFVIPSKQAIDGVVSVTKYGVDQLIGISGSYGKTELDRLTAFSDAASKGYAALGAAANAGSALGKEDRTKPADALNQLLGEFNAGLAPLDQLVKTSQTYLAQGNAFHANMADAYAALGGALPGFNPAQAAASASVTVSGQQEQVIVHRHEPQVVRLEFLGENGAWIVKSLTVDGGARRQAAELIADEVAAVLDTPAT